MTEAKEQTDTDIVERLRGGTVQRKRRWSGDTHAELGGSCDEDATDAIMTEAAAELTRLKEENERLRKERDAIRSQVIEECAKVADKILDDPKASGREIAKAIRSLNSTDDQQQKG